MSHILSCLKDLFHYKAVPLHTMEALGGEEE
jgi:hypothetical protein